MITFTRILVNPLLEKLTPALIPSYAGLFMYRGTQWQLHAHAHTFQKTFQSILTVKETKTQLSNQEHAAILKKKLAWKHEFQPFGVFATGCNTFFPHCSSSSHNLLHKRSRKTQRHTVKILAPWQPLHTHEKSWVIASELLSHKLLLYVLRFTPSYTETRTLAHAQLPSHSRIWRLYEHKGNIKMAACLLIKT